MERSTDTDVISDRAVPTEAPEDWSCSTGGLGLDFRATGEWAPFLREWSEGWSHRAGTTLATITSGEAAARPSGDIDYETDDIIVQVRGTERWIGDKRGAAGHIVGGTLTLSGDPSTRAAHRIMAFALAAIVGDHGYDLLHAGMIAPPDRDPLLVLGGSGQGKSTLIGAALAAGWRVFSDDHVLLRRTGAGTEACAVPLRINVPAEAIHDPVGWSAAVDRRGRRAATTVSADQGWRAIAGTVQVAHGTEPHTTCTPSTAHEALKALIGSHMLATTAGRVRVFLGTAARIAERPAWALRHGQHGEGRLPGGVAALELIAAG